MDRDGAPVDLEPKDALLLAYLAIEGPTPRGRLAALLWPDVDEERARGNLRQRLLRLKRAIGGELVTGNPNAALAAEVAHDLSGAHELLNAVELSQAGGLAEWLESQREQRRRARIDEIDAACARSEAEGDLATALEHANALIALDPLSEHAHRRVMKLHYLRGDTAAAMAAYERCRQMLERELGVPPSRETEALRASVGTALEAPASGYRAPPLSMLRPPRLVGRDAEWATLQTAWDAAQSAVVLGEGGLGKTRLVTDFARAMGVVAIVSSRPGDEGVAYALATRLLRHLPKEPLASLGAPVRRELARLLPEYGEATPISSENARVRFYNAVGAALAAAAERMSGIVIDDLHFADEASVELIQYLASEGRLGWLFAARPGELRGTALALVEALRSRSAHSVVTLAPLTLPQLAEFVDTLAIDGLTGAETAPALMRQTGGNPLFVLETLKAWLAQRRDGSGGRLPVAANLGAMVERRIGRLSAEAVRLARCAAVAGQDFSAELAAHVLGVRALDLADAWMELEAAQVFRDGAFAHDLIHEAARASVPAPIARELHGQIAVYLTERQLPPGRLAEHWLAAGRKRQALAALLRAAASARHETLRLAEAAQWYERAAELAEELDDHDAAFRALYDLVDTWISLDRTRLDTALLDRLDAHAATPRQQALALWIRGHVLVQLGRCVESMAVSQRAADLARAAGDDELVAASISDAAAAASQVGDSERAVRMLRPLLPWTLEHGSHETQFNLLGHLAIGLDNIDHQDEAQSIHRRAIEAALRACRYDEAVSAWGNLAISLLDVGRPRAALGAIAQARSASVAYDALQGNTYTLNLFEGVASMGLRRYRAALAALEAALADVAYNALGAAAVHVHRACLFIHLGQYARAQRELNTPASAGPLPDWLEARRQQMLGRCAWSLGRKPEAARHLQAASESAPTRERAVLAVMIALDRAQVQPAEQALVSVRVALERAERLGHFGSALAARIRLAALACEAGDMDTALQAQAGLEQTPDDVEPNDLYGGERWLAAVRVLRAAGRHDEAARTAAEAADAVRRIARDDVPPEFRDAFLDRNPVNRELLTLATRLH